VGAAVSPHLDARRVTAVPVGLRAGHWV
jgi:hypothetical protein